MDKKNLFEIIKQIISDGYIGVIENKDDKMQFCFTKLEGNLNVIQFTYLEKENSIDTEKGIFSTMEEVKKYIEHSKKQELIYNA